MLLYDFVMKVMILAAGLGTRLKPLTDRMPKALVPIEGRPLLDIVVSHLISQGATEVVINVHHFGEQIIDFVRHKQYGIPLRISDERATLLDTGGALRHAFPLFNRDNDPILIHNVDILSTANLRSLYESSAEVDATLLVSNRVTSRYLLFDDGMRLKGWCNEQTGEIRSPYPDLNVSSLRKYAFSGIHCVSPGLCATMQTWPDKFSIIDFYLSTCSELNIRGMLQDHLEVLDVGKLVALTEARDWLHNHVSYH